MTAQQQDWLDAADRVDHGPVHVPGDGPHDVEDLDPEVTLAAGTVDFGAVRVPVPDRGTVDVDPAEKGRMQAVHVAVPEGRLSVSALAAPKSSRLWPDLAKEIDASLREGGARVRSFQGEWGRELHATSGAATSLFVGVDGARWMLYGVATGPTSDARALDEQLRRMLRGTIVVRGRSPYPVRTVLPLEVPEHLAPPAPDATGSVVELRPSAAAAPDAQPAASTTALPAVARAAHPAVAHPAVAHPTAAQPAVAHPAVAQPAAAQPRTVQHPTVQHPTLQHPTLQPPSALPPSAQPWTASPTTALPAAQRSTASPATTALPLLGRSAGSGWSPEGGRPPGEVSPPTTAFPVAPSRAGDPARWSDPVHRIADPGAPQPLDAGPDPDDRPTDIRPSRGDAPPVERWTAGGSETAPWALDPPGSGGRRRLREPQDRLPASPGLTGPWAPWPESPTGSRRAAGPGLRSNGHQMSAVRRPDPGQAPWERAASPADPPRTGRPSEGAPLPPSVQAAELAMDPRPGRRRLADPVPADARPSVEAPVPPGAQAPGLAVDPRPGRRRLVDPVPADARPDPALPAPPRTGRRRAPEPPPTEALAVVPEVLRVGRHAAAESAGESAPDRAGRGAETRPWVVSRSARPVVDTAPWSAVSGPGPDTEPLPTTPPAAERPTGRHHRSD